MLARIVPKDTIQQKRLIEGNLTKWVCKIAFLFMFARRHQRYRAASFRGAKRGRWYTRVYARARPRMAFSSPVPPSLSPFFSTWATWRRVLATGDSCRGLIGRYLARRVWFRVSLGQRGKERIRNIGRRATCRENPAGSRQDDSSSSPIIVTDLYSVSHSYCHPGIFEEYNLIIWICSLNLLFFLHFINILSRRF